MQMGMIYIHDTYMDIVFVGTTYKSVENQRIVQIN